MGFDGPVWPVHPVRAQIGGLPCVPTLADLPAPPDATFIGVNRHATLDVVEELAAMGAGGAICFASGWRETGDGDLQDRLVKKAGTMPILGPNCYGLINYLDGALLWPDQHGGRRVARGVALLSQSSNIAINLTMQALALQTMLETDATLEEIEINPLIVRDSGAVAVDAVILRESP